MKNLVVKDNALIEASHRLGEVEQRLVLLAILKARTMGNTVEQIKDKMLIIHADDYIKHFSGTRQGAYKALKQGVMGLFEAKWGYKYLTDNGETRVRYERFTQSADYGDGNGVVKFMFSTAIVPMLMELEKQFTVYDIEQISKLSSGYSMRLYEFCIQHLDKKTGKGWLDISLDELRFRFGLLPTEYMKMGNFKARVLDYAINDLNKNTDLSIRYVQKKQGRVIVGFRFEFEQKIKKQNLKSKNIESKPKIIDIFSEFTDLERKTIQKRIDEHIKRLEQKGEVVGEFHRNNITKKAVSERWGLDVLAEKERKKQLRQAEIAKEKAQKQVEQEKKKQRQKEMNELKKRVSEKFESLSLEQKENILNQVAQKIGAGAAFTQPFKTARAVGTAHTDTRFLTFFAECFNL